MIDILATTLTKGDPRGVICLASILWLFIVICLYAPNPIFGSCTCAVIFLICCFALGDGGNYGPGYQNTPNKAFIANRNQTKFLEKYLDDINHKDCIFMIDKMGTQTPVDDEQLFVPANEIVVIDGWKCMKSTGEMVDIYGDEDSYVYNKPIAPINLAVEHGGHGVPTWLYHPASALWIFGLGAAPMILVGGAAVGKMKQ